MKRSQSSNARPRTRLSRSFSATSPRKHGWKITLAVVSGATLLLVSVFFLQARLGGFGSPVKTITGSQDGTYEDDDNTFLDDGNGNERLQLFGKKTQEVDGATFRKNIDLEDLEEEGDEFDDGKVDGKVEEFDEDELDGDEDVDVVKQDEKPGEEEDEEDEEGDESLRDEEGDELETGQQEKEKEKEKEPERKENTTVKRLERLGQIKTLPRRAPEVSGNKTSKEKENRFLWDHFLGIIKLPVENNNRTVFLSGRKLGAGKVMLEKDTKTGSKDRMFFSSDDEPMDSKLLQGVSDVADVEDALLLRKEKQANAKVFGAMVMQKPAPLRNVFDSKLYRKVAKPPYDPANPTGNFLLQDPDTVEPWGLTKSDKAISRAFRSGLVEAAEERRRRSTAVKPTKGRKELLETHEERRKASRRRSRGDTRRWGFFPGLDSMLSFSEFMEEFLSFERCEARVFMSWNSPPWSFTVRHQRGLESLLYFHPKASVVVFSETLELDFFKKFVKKSYRVAVVRPNLEEFLEATPAEIFASVWLEWRKTNLFYVHYSELLRLAALYRYGGIYLDSDIIVLKPLDGLRNSVGLELTADGKHRLNGAVMVFDKESHFIRACLEEYTATYDDKLVDWNGAELLTRVAGNSSWTEGELHTLPPDSFFPLSSDNVTRYFEGQVTEEEDMLRSSYTLHLWSRESASFVPGKDSLIGSVLERHCIWCSDII